MRNVRLWRGLLGVDRRTVIEDIEFSVQGDGVELVVARVRPRSGFSGRCGRCQRKAPWYDRGEGRRRWRETPDELLGKIKRKSINNTRH